MKMSLQQVYQNNKINEWLMHQTIREYYGNFEKSYSMPVWWKEYGAFICTAPRQIGKTQIIKVLSENLESTGEKCLTICSSCKYINNLSRNRGLSNVHAGHVFIKNPPEIQGFIPSETHLFIDEFQRLNKDDLDSLLDHEWRSVSLFGTLI